MSRPTAALACITVVLALPQSAPARGESAREVAERAQEVLFGYETLSATGEMTLLRDGERLGERSFDLALLERDGADDDYGLVTITSPAALRDTKLLSWSAPDGEERQWLFTPRSAKTRRIADRGRKAAFVSSTYAFEDLVRWQLESYEYESLERIDCPSGRCRRVTALPTRASSSYARLVIDYDDEYRMRRVLYFRPGSDAPWKEQRVEDYLRIGDSWQPGTSEMRDLESGETTRIVWSDYRENARLRPSSFSPNAL